MIGGAGDDTYVVDSTDDVITENAGEGSDTVETSANYTLAADLESLTLTGSDNINGTGNGLDNTILGNSGNNVLVGGAGNDTLNGGGGTDTASYTNTTPIIATLGLNGVNGSATGDGTDVLISIENLQGGGGNDTLTGNEQANKLEGGGGNDTLNGGSGSDTLDGGVGADSMTGGLGDDTYVVDSTGDAVTEAAGEGTDTVQSTITYILGENLENLTLTGSNVINGTGNSANNILNGNSSANRLDGGLGADTMAGGAGDDTYVVDNSGDVVTEAASAGADTIEASVSYTLSANVEKLILKEGSGNINATGNVDTNTLIGNSGNNILDGGNGDDTLIGGGGSDTLIGGGGSDTLVVSASDLKSSIFKGESGTDTLKITASVGGTIDLTGINNANFVSIEKIDLTETTGNTELKLNLESIRSLVDISSGIPTLSVKLGSGDTISFAPESNQQVFDNASSKTMTVFGSSGSSLEQLAIISYA
jgi:Ca2+-binding RTX toxin-like protein